MRIGQLAEQAQVNVQTVRLYERMGLLRQPARTAAGYRDYSPAAVERLCFIKDAQQLGFTLKEIKTLLLLREPRHFASQRLRQLVETKIGEIDDKLARLTAMRADLQYRLAACSCRGEAEKCLLLQTRKG